MHATQTKRDHPAHDGALDQPMRLSGFKPDLADEQSKHISGKIALETFIMLIIDPSSYRRDHIGAASCACAHGS